LSLSKEATVKPAFLAQMQGLLGLEENCLLVEELGIEHGAARIDVATIGDCVHGFEIKADADSLSRLAHQASHYEKLVDFAYLVCTERHFQTAMEMLPAHWGLILATCARGPIEFVVRRTANKNTLRSAESLARLLWRGEALAMLCELGLDRGVRQKSARVIHECLAQSLNLEELGSRVLRQLRLRPSWGTRQCRPTYLASWTLRQES
jgi:hypothetical protein